MRSRTLSFAPNKASPEDYLEDSGESSELYHPLPQPPFVTDVGETPSKEIADGPPTVVPRASTYPHFVLDSIRAVH